MNPYEVDNDVPTTTGFVPASLPMNSFAPVGLEVPPGEIADVTDTPVAVPVFWTPQRLRMLEAAYDQNIQQYGRKVRSWEESKNNRTPDLYDKILTLESLIRSQDSILRSHGTSHRPHPSFMPRNRATASLRKSRSRRRHYRKGPARYRRLNKNDCTFTIFTTTGVCRHDSLRCPRVAGCG